MQERTPSEKKILLIAGSAREDIDGVRYFANRSLPPTWGYEAAKELTKLPYAVTVITPPSAFPFPKECRIVSSTSEGYPLLSGSDLLEMADTFLSIENYDAVFCLAVVSSFRAAKRSEHKLKIKRAVGEEILLSVRGNIDIERRARSWKLPVCGIDSRQNPFLLGPHPDWMNAGIDAVCKIQESDLLLKRPEKKCDAPSACGKDRLKGRKIIVTSGPTEEKISENGDVITNFSSGRQGFEIAGALAKMGAHVFYVAGPTEAPIPVHENIEHIAINSASSMLDACEALLPVDVYIGVAAVADFGCAAPSNLFLNPDESADLKLRQNPDILERMGRHPSKRPAFVVGFAAETNPETILDYAYQKRVAKNADLICANVVGSLAGHAADENQIVLLTREDEPRALTLMTKEGVARALAEKIATHFV